MMRKFLIPIIIFLSFFFAILATQAEDNQNPVVLYFFYGDGCPHCHHEQDFLKKMQIKYPDLQVKEYEIWHNEDHLNLYRHIALGYGEETGYVPATFLDRRSWVGYSQQKSLEIEQAIEECFNSFCFNPLDIADQVEKNLKKKEHILKSSPKKNEKKTHIPFLGFVDIEKMSLPLLTIILGGLDGFNPCAFFVLLMLLSLMVHAQSRAKMLIVGGVFVFFSGFVYFLFMMAWLNIFMMTSKIAYITFSAGLIAVLMALLNIKDYFFFKKGISLTLSEKDQNTLLTKMRQLIRTGSLWGLLLGTISLAFMANLYELLCTAGFPMVFTRALTLQNLSLVEYYLYLVFYNVIYVLPLLTIVLIFVFTLGSRKLTEQEGRNLKLLSGLMMLSLGGILLFKPALLNNVLVSIALIVAVIFVGLLIMILNKKGWLRTWILIGGVFFLLVPSLQAQDSKESINVMTTLFATYDFTKQIAQDKANVSLILPPGVEPHSFEPKAKDILHINQADIFIYTGDEMEPWVQKILQGLQKSDLLVVNVSKNIPLKVGDDKDPHIWLDFDFAQTMIQTISKSLIEKDPQHESFYKEQAQSYQKQLQALDAHYRKTLSTAQQKTIFYAGHFAFGYLAKRYDLKHVSPYANFAPNAEPSPKAMIELIKNIQESNIKWIFYEELIDPKVARIIAEATHTQMEVLHAAHNVSLEELQAGVTFLKIMEDNLQKLKIGLECQ